VNIFLEPCNKHYLMSFFAKLTIRKEKEFKGGVDEINSMGSGSIGFSQLSSFCHLYKANVNGS